MCRAALVSIFEAKIAAWRIRMIEKIALERNKASTPPETHGSVWALTAGKPIPPKTKRRSGSLPEAKKTAVEAIMNPTARIPAKSSIERKARKKVKRNQVLRSPGFIKDMLAWMGFVMSQF
jgi:hypothetical protein